LTHYYLVALLLKPKLPHSLSADDLTRLRRADPTPIRAPVNLVEDGVNPWAFSLVGKFRGHALATDKIMNSLSTKWSPETEWGDHSYELWVSPL